MHLAGSKASLDLDNIQLAKLVTNAGCKAIQRNTTYSSFEEYIPPQIPKRRRLPMIVGE